MREYECRIDEVPLLDREPACCVGLDPEPCGDLLRECFCRFGCHRVVQSSGFRTVYDMRQNTANPAWQGFR